MDNVLMLAAVCCVMFVAAYWVIRETRPYRWYYYPLHGLAVVWVGYWLWMDAVQTLGPSYERIADRVAICIPNVKTEWRITWCAAHEMRRYLPW